MRMALIPSCSPVSVKPEPGSVSAGCDPRHRRAGFGAAGDGLQDTGSLYCSHLAGGYGRYASPQEKQKRDNVIHGFSNAVRIAYPQSAPKIDVG